MFSARRTLTSKQTGPRVVVGTRGDRVVKLPRCGKEDRCVSFRCWRKLEFVGRDRVKNTRHRGEHEVCEACREPGTCSRTQWIHMPLWER